MHQDSSLHLPAAAHHRGRDCTTHVKWSTDDALCSSSKVRTSLHERCKPIGQTSNEPGTTKGIALLFTN